MRQQISGGSNNIQAGRDVLIDHGPKFSPDNPNALKCPQCWRTTGRLSHECGNCHYRVKEHFDAIARENACSKLRGFGLTAGSISIGLVYIAQHWLAHTSFSVTLNVTAFGALLVAGICFRASEDC